MNAASTLEANMADRQKRNISQVINEYSKRLFGFIRKRVSSEADAEDILQDVFYQFIGNTQPIEQLTAWLFTVARNKITDRQRKKKNELIEDLFAGTDEEEKLNWAELFFEEGQTPETEYLRSLFWETLNNALQELPEEQRYAFVMNELEDVSFKELAAQTGESISTLISRKRYAVLHLRERLQSFKNELLNY